MEAMVTSTYRFDPWQALAVASITGALTGATGLALSAMLTTTSENYVAVIPVFLFAAVFSFPFWSIGVGLIGLPIRAVFDRFGYGGPIAATLIGAVLVGAVWTAFNWPWMAVRWSPEWWSKVANIATGFLSGALAGYIGWVTGRSRAAS